jgi:hypothetical protein
MLFFLPRDMLTEIAQCLTSNEYTSLILTGTSIARVCDFFYTFCIKNGLQFNRNLQAIHREIGLLKLKK